MSHMTPKISKPTLNECIKYMDKWNINILMQNNSLDLPKKKKEFQE